MCNDIVPALKMQVAQNPEQNLTGCGFDGDEFDEDEDHIHKISDTEYTIDAIAEIDEFNEVFGTKYSDINVDTIGGLLVQHIERLPKEGEVIALDNFVFTVLNADNRRVNKLHLKLDHS